MANLAFTNKDVAEKFEATIENDVVINRSNYQGKLSNIPLAVAEEMAKISSNYLQEKKKQVAAPKQS